MRSIACLAAAAALLTAAPAAALAQTPAPASTAARPGLAIADVSAWLTSKGGQVSAIQREGTDIYVTVTDGPMTWAVFFYGCTGDVCGDIQYTAAFSNPTITFDKVNDWNRERRFLKAFYVPAATGGDPSAAVQYDVLIHEGGIDQLTDPTAVWIGMVGDFATQVGYFAAEGEAAPAAPPAH